MKLCEISGNKTGRRDAFNQRSAIKKAFKKAWEFLHLDERKLLWDFFFSFLFYSENGLLFHSDEGFRKETAKQVWQYETELQILWQEPFITYSYKTLLKGGSGLWTCRLSFTNTRRGGQHEFTEIFQWRVHLFTVINLWFHICLYFNCLMTRTIIISPPMDEAKEEGNVRGGRSSAEHRLVKCIGSCWITTVYKVIVPYSL